MYSTFSKICKRRSSTRPSRAADSRGFPVPLLAEATDVFVLHGIEPNQVNDDTRPFFRHSFSELKGPRLGLDGWPTDEQLDLLCERAEGLFVHAMATIRFIGQRNSNSKKQLGRLLKSPGSNAFEGKTKLRTGATLDALYALLLSVHSLLILQEDTDHPVRPFHKSFPDFIVDPVRYPNPRFRVCPADQHTELLIGCLELMNRRLKQNICELPDGISNLEVKDLRERTEKHIGQALQYFCRSWHKHLIDVIPIQALQIIPVLHRFLEERFLFWLEVLSVLDITRVAVDALEATVRLLDTSPTLNLVRDYLRFIITFFKAINVSAPHIYHSALLLSPQTSIICGLYAERYARPLARVVRGLPASWEPTIATAYYKGIPISGAWSPDNKCFAFAQKSGSIRVLDAVTLKTLHIFEQFPNYGDARRLCFSPDSRLLAGLAIWDLQTGGPVGTGPQETFPSSFLHPRIPSTESYLRSIAPNVSQPTTILPGRAYRTWSGRFLGLGDRKLLEAIILEFLE